MTEKKIHKKLQETRRLKAEPAQLVTVNFVTKVTFLKSLILPSENI